MASRGLKIAQDNLSLDPPSLQSTISTIINFQSVNQLWQNVQGASFCEPLLTGVTLTSKWVDLLKCHKDQWFRETNNFSLIL